MIDRYIRQQIERRGITLYDMIGGKYIDPDPDDPGFVGERARWNRFKSLFEEDRFCELLTEGDFDNDDPYGNIAVPIKDLIRYWWNNVADRYGFLDYVFEDLFIHYKDRLLPRKEPKNIDDVCCAIEGVLESLKNPNTESEFP